MVHAIAAMIEVLEQDQHHLYLVCKPQIDKLLQTLKDILRFTPYLIFIPYDLDIRIVDAVHTAEDVIEVHIMSQVLENDSVSQLDLTDVMEEFESLKLKLLQITPNVQEVEEVPWYPNLGTKDDIPGIFEDCFHDLKDKLISGPSKLRIISIDGIRGNGKRTLARRLYNDPEIADHFRVRAWVSCPVTVSEKSCLLNLLEGLGMLTDDLRGKDVDELKVHLRFALMNIKYFIVIHDVVKEENLVTFTKLFRNYRVGARIMYTAWSIDLSGYGGEIYTMRFMTESESWLLLCHKVFGFEDCPDELEPFGETIVELCYGIPLAVTLIAGFLATSEQVPAIWEKVATIMSVEIDGLTEFDDIVSTVFDIIYSILPYYLKPCLLYTGAFYESREIRSSKIIQLWIAEGFVKESAGESLEDVGEMYLNSLIDKNLLDFTRVEPVGRVKSFESSLSTRMACWVIAAREKFLGSQLSHELGLQEDNIMRRLSSNGLFEASNEMELPPLARSFLYSTGASPSQVFAYLKLRLLRVLDAFQLEFYQVPEEIAQLVFLRYLAFSCHSNLHTSVSLLQNLQSLIIRRVPTFRAFSLPSDLWELTQLRHVKCKESFIWYYREEEKGVVHEQLQTLTNVQLLGIENEFLAEVPNIKKLGIFCNIAMHTFFDLACLDKLETLKCSSDWSLASRNFLSYLTLPVSLIKLTLSLCRIPSGFMEVVDSLPNLEILKLHKSDFLGLDSVKSELIWETMEWGFPKLLSLEMVHLNLVHWKTQASHFPNLMYLDIQNCYAMVEIPLDIGNIPSLELIQVDKTSPSTLVSALKIKEDQERRGNDLLQLRTYSYAF